MWASSKDGVVAVLEEVAVLEVEVREEREGREGAVASLVEGRGREEELGAALAWERLEGRNRVEVLEARWEKYQNRLLCHS